MGSNHECSGLQFSKKNDITTWVWSDIGEEICYAADRFDINVICLAGFLKRVHVHTSWNNRIINIHPALLPKCQGMHGKKVHEQIINDKDEFSGCTVHFCDDEYDTGPIILQSKLRVNPLWDATQLADKVFELEKKAFPLALESYRHCSNNGLVDVNELHRYIALLKEENDEPGQKFFIPSTTEIVD